MKAFSFLVPALMLGMAFFFGALVIGKHNALFLYPEIVCLIAYVVSYVYAMRRNPK